MKDELLIIEKMITEMAAVFNVLPGEVVRMKDSDTLLILQRRMEDSELKRALVTYNEGFTKANGISVEELCECVIAYVKIKTLVQCKVTDFEQEHKRIYDKELKNQKIKLENIIHLSKVNIMTADAYQKEFIEQTLKKNEAFLAAFINEIEKLAKEIEKEADERLSEENSKLPDKALDEDMQKDKSNDKSNKSGIKGMFSKEKREKIRSKKEIDKRLKSVEKKYSRTMCEEIPYYDSKLSYNEKLVCKDIPGYSIYKRKNNVYFGLSKNGQKGTYDNKDMSLTELTVINMSFLQYMTEDLLNGEYELTHFTPEEKVALRMYFNYITKMFEKNIGVTLTVMEYMNFKFYYNKLIMVMYELERQYKNTYYMALSLADEYKLYMDCYGLESGDDIGVITENIMMSNSTSYIKDLELIIVHHIVDNESKNMINELISMIKTFGCKSS